MFKKSGFIVAMLVLLIFSASVWGSGVVDTNINTLTNTNRNNNTNLQGQAQGQDQDQKQKQDQDQNQGQLQGQGQDQSINFAPVTQRDFVNPGTINYPGLVTMGVDQTLGMYYQPYTEILMLQNTFTESQLKVMAASQGFSIGTTVRTEKIGVPGTYEKGKERTVTFYIDKTALPAAIAQIGFADAGQNSKKGTSRQLFGIIGLKAIDMGGNAVLLLNQGYQKSLTSKGFGLGISTTAARMGDQGDESQVATGGTGISFGSSTVLQKPWIRSIVLFIK